MTLTDTEIEMLREAVRPPVKWADHGARVVGRLLDEEDATFALETLAPAVEAIIAARLAAAWAAHVAAERDRAVAEALGGVADYRTAIERVQALHTQTSDIGLAPGKWCPACGQETPCQTILATLTPPPRLGHLSREELRQRALDFDMEEEHAQRRRESAALRAALPAEPEGTA